MKLRWMLFGLLPLVLVQPSNATTRITGDMGGPIGDYLLMFAAIRDSREQVSALVQFDDFRRDLSGLGELFLADERLRAEEIEPVEQRVANVGVGDLVDHTDHALDCFAFRRSRDGKRQSLVSTADVGEFLRRLDLFVKRSFRRVVVADNAGDAVLHRGSQERVEFVFRLR